MTYNEIKKAFNDALILDSMNIELWHDKEDKPILLPLKEVAELINHLQESKEYYKKSRDKCQDNVMYLSKKCDEWQEKCDRLQTENKDKEALLNHQGETIKTLENVIKNTFLKNAGLDIDPLAEIKAEAYKEFAEQLDAEIESSDKYIREYDDSEVQKAYNKGLRDALKVLKEMVGEDNG